MEFKEECVQDFLHIFNFNFDKISNFNGCISLKLVQEKNNICRFLTLSEWENETDLENYRNSEFFKATWKKTKILFKRKPKALTTFLINH